MTMHINDVRQHLMDTLAALRSEKNPMDLDRARVVGQISGVLVDTARVEIEFLKVTGEKTSPFLEVDDMPRITTKTEGLPAGFVSVTQHRLQK